MEMVTEMLSYPFLVRALVGGILVSLCASLLGVSLVLKRYSMIGDGLSHVSFGALSIAVAAGWSPLKISIPVVNHRTWKDQERRGYRHDIGGGPGDRNYRYLHDNRYDDRCKQLYVWKHFSHDQRRRGLISSIVHHCTGPVCTLLQPGICSYL